MARLYFLPENSVTYPLINFPEDISHHLAILHVQKGDHIACIYETSEGRMKADVIVTSLRPHAQGSIISSTPLTDVPPHPIHIIQAIPKGDKMETIIQKCSELGAVSIYPVFSRFSDVQGHIGDNKLQRWRRIAMESAGQSGRTSVLTIHDPCSLSDWLAAYSSESSFALICNEHEEAVHLYDLEDHLPSASSIYCLIGAEGGFHESEIAKAKEKKIFSISLGHHILRTETAPIALVAIVQYLLHEL